MTERLATELRPGDRIVDSGDFPKSFFAGVVAKTEIVASRVRIDLENGSFCVRSANHKFTVDVKRS